MVKYKLYHLSNVEYPELKSKTLINPNAPGLQEYDKLISFLLTPVTASDISNYIKAGFKRWDMKESYLYIVDPASITNYDFAMMQSTPQQSTYDDENWDYDPKVMRSHQFDAWREEYMRKRTKALHDLYGIPPKGTIEEYMSNPLYKEWQEHVWVNYNMKQGSIEQYASYIPHLQVCINEPVQYEKVIKLR